MAGKAFMTLVTALHARTQSMPHKFGGVAFFTPGRVESLRAILGEFNSNGQVNTDDARLNYEWNTRVMSRSTAYTPQGPVDPFYLYEHYGSDSDDPNGKIVEDDFTTAAELAVRWVVRGEYEAGVGAVRILDAWSRVSSFSTNAASGLNWGNKWPMMIQAATMLRDHPAYTAALHARLQDVTRRAGVVVRLIGWDAPNNFGAWAVCYEMASAGFLGDRAQLNRAITRWRTLFDYAVVDNVPVHEIYRQSSGYGDGSYGLWYSNFFLYGMTAAAEWARFNGEWLYDYVGENGSSFKGLALLIRHWTRYPEQYPYNSSGTPSSTARILAHDDILHALWPSDESAWLLANFTSGSIRDVFGLRSAPLAYRYRPLYG